MSELRTRWRECGGPKTCEVCQANGKHPPFNADAPAMANHVPTENVRQNRNADAERAFTRQVGCEVPDCGAVGVRAELERARELLASTRGMVDVHLQARLGAEQERDAARAEVAALREFQLNGGFSFGDWRKRIQAETREACAQAVESTRGLGGRFSAADEIAAVVRALVLPRLLNCQSLPVR